MRHFFSTKVRVALILALLLALPLGLLGARVFYCLARLDFYIEMGLQEMFLLWHGGYALWGAGGGAEPGAVLLLR